MQVPIEIAFHNVDSTEWAETMIRERIDELERRFERITSFRVRVERRAKSNGVMTVPPVVRLEIGVPGRADLVVSHEPEFLQRKFQRPDLQKAINEAFRIAERQLLALKEQREGRTNAPYSDIQNQRLGQVAEVQPEQDFGYLVTSEGSLLYFHRNSVLTGDFDALGRGDELYYVEGVGDTGPVATKVRVKAAD
ncbi:HPF/RaiA family ribosome-associated protein [Rhodovulum sp. PH10]|uniref:HPF/RaiA family ribosome-associated protein n=1 Tax=Rhodovulum sp. PH10 TaxID=1187851 RepID=UPI00058BC15F|nr:HPF/RaiA family ribosome-associated protein [Rhodovulum sp. PH10]